MVPGVDQVDLGALHGHWAASSDLARHGQSPGHQGLLVGKHSAERQPWGGGQRGLDKHGLSAVECENLLYAASGM